MKEWIERRIKRIGSEFFTAEPPETKEIFRENEISANLLVARVLHACAVLMVLSMVLDLIGVYVINKIVMAQLTGIDLVLLLPPYIACRRYKGDKRYLKNFMLTGLVLTCAATDLVLGYNAVLLMALPVVLSSRYYNRRLTAYIAVISTVTYALSCAYGYLCGMIDMNFVQLDPGTVLTIETNIRSAVFSAGYSVAKYEKALFMHSFLPRYLLYLVIATLSAEIAHRGYLMVVRQYTVTKERTRIDTELEMAHQIQEHALPIVHELTDKTSFELAADMVPAKEIGGDFYDFIRLDDTHLALMIADVSGKGIPAAMYMMVSKLLLDNSLQNQRSPGAVLAEVNHQLCEKNLDNMFVTVWLGIIDLVNGTVITANAGHEYPIICRKDGVFEVVKDRHGLVLGAMDGLRYRETELKLEPGDTLFVYTDGVTEANDEKGGMFGLDNTCRALNEARGGDMEELLKALHRNLGAHMGSAPQFDDITMMGFRINWFMSEKGKTVVTAESTIPEMQEYLETALGESGLAPKLITKMNIAIDEIFSNIVHYSGASWANGCVEISDKAVTVVFRDNGIPYDPQTCGDPELSADPEQREIGGLGLFMTRKLLDDFTYEYKDGININRLTMNLQ